MSRRAWQSGVVMLAALAATACTTMGSGTGETRGGGPEVHFDWKADGPIKGDMTAFVDGGGTYKGKLFQITSDTRVDDLGPLWAGWRGWGWGAWPFWDAGPEFITHYSGRVVANLTDPDGDHMRCNFRLIHPSAGMAGGGQGKCQLSDGRTIDATFPAA